MSRNKTILALAAALLAIRTARHYYARQRCPKPPLRKLRGPLFRDAPATTFGIHTSCDGSRKFGTLALAAIRRHPSYARRRCPADIEFVCLNSPEELLRLPIRAGKYVVWMLGVQLDSCVWEFTERCLDWYNVFSTRSDFLYASLDLGDHRLCDDAHGALPGSVMLERTLGPAVESSARPTLLAFAGQNHEGWFGSSRARPNLFEAYDAWRAAGGDGRRVVIKATAPRSAMRRDGNYTSLLRDSRFGLAPRGDGRWTWRLTELMQSGTIPVVLADGLSLPFHHLIDWTAAALHPPESMARNFSGLVATVSVAPARLFRMRTAVRRVYAQCMVTPRGFADCLLRDLALAAHAYDAPPLKAAESLRGGPDCPSHDMDAEADKCGWSGKRRPCTNG